MYLYQLCCDIGEGSRKPFVILSYKYGDNLDLKQITTYHDEVGRNDNFGNESHARKEP